MLVTNQILALVFAVVFAAWADPLISRFQARFAIGEVFKQDVIALAVLARGDDIPSPREERTFDWRHWGTLKPTPENLSGIEGARDSTMRRKSMAVRRAEG